MASKTIEKDKTFSDAEGKLYNYNSMKIMAKRIWGI